MTHKQPEELLEDAMINVYRAHDGWRGPSEAEKYLMQAMANLAYADAMWGAQSRDSMEQ